MDDLRHRLAKGTYCAVVRDASIRSTEMTGYPLMSEAEIEASWDEAVEDQEVYLRMADYSLSVIAKTHRLVRLDGGPHGTYSRYTNGRCRCDLCREANRDRGRRYRKELKERENG